MCIIVYEENRHNRKRLKKIFAQLQQYENVKDTIYFFDESEQALLCAESGKVVAAFVSVQDSKGHGYFLTKRLRSLDRRLNLIPMAESLLYAKELVAMHVSGYLLGEVTKDKVIEELENLRYPVA